MVWKRRTVCSGSTCSPARSSWTSRRCRTPARTSSRSCSGQGWRSTTVSWSSPTVRTPATVPAPTVLPTATSSRSRRQGGPLHYFQIGSGQDRGAVWMGGSSPVVDPHGNVYVASADGYDLGAGQPLRRQRRGARAVADHAPRVDLLPQGLADAQRRRPRPRDRGPRARGWFRVPGRQDGHRLPAASGTSRRRGGRGRVAFDVQRQPRRRTRGGGLGRLRALPERRDGDQGVDQGPVPETAVDRQRRRRRRDRSSPMDWSGRLEATTRCTASTRPTARRSSRSPSAGTANHFPTPSVGDGLLLLPGTDQVFAFMGPAGLPPPPPAR